MKFEQLRRRPVPAGIEGVLLSPGERALLPVPADEPLDLARCFRSGQIFRWRQQEERWYGPFGSSALALRETPRGVEVEAAGPTIPLGDVYRFLGLDAPVEAIRRAVATDMRMAGAAGAFPGLRILRQEPWDCLASYLCAQWNNIPKIERSTGEMARRWGAVRRFQEGEEVVEVACFPTPEALAARSEAELRACALGYRCRYIIGTARLLAGGAIDLRALRGAPYGEALAALLRLPGIGRKVADCILLFALDHWEAFPIDVWIRRAMRRLYRRPLRPRLPAPEDAPMAEREYRTLAAFAWERWGAVAGWAQEYLYCAARAGMLA